MLSRPARTNQQRRRDEFARAERARRAPKPLRCDAALVTVQDARAFLMEPASEVEDALLRHLNQDLVRAGFDPLPDGFIEWGCVEHDVIHICAFEGQQWIELDPKTGVIQAL